MRSHAAVPYAQNFSFKCAYALVSLDSVKDLSLTAVVFAAIRVIYGDLGRLSEYYSGYDKNGSCRPNISWGVDAESKNREF